MQHVPVLKKYIVSSHGHCLAVMFRTQTSVAFSIARHYSGYDCYLEFLLSASISLAY